MQDQIYDMLLNKEEITWKTLLLELVKSEQMNPWDIDISLLSRKYLETLKTLKETNLAVSGKVILASALLLKIKSDRFLNQDLTEFDSKLYPSEEVYEEIDQELLENAPSPENPKLTIKTPMPRKRRVTLNDLMGALQKALEVNKRRILREIEYTKIDVEIPQKKIDITSLIYDVYDKIKGFFSMNDKGKLTFSVLVDSDRKEDKILTFIPLLHLANQEKIDLNQEKHFGDIYINILKKNEDK
ncbi:segregation/condensation protein A [archaeon]|nr:segregation/condensation protein A [archaeon]